MDLIDFLQDHFPITDWCFTCDFKRISGSDLKQYVSKFEEGIAAKF